MVSVTICWVQQDLLISTPESCTWGVWLCPDSSLILFMNMHICTYLLAYNKHVCAHVEATHWHPVPSLYLFTPLFLETESHIIDEAHQFGYAVRTVGSSNPLISIPPVLQVQTNTPPHAAFYQGFGGSELRSSCFHCKHFLNRAISPARFYCSRIIGLYGQYSMETIWWQIRGTEARSLKFELSQLSFKKIWLWCTLQVQCLQWLRNELLVCIIAHWPSHWWNELTELFPFKEVIVTCLTLDSPRKVKHYHTRLPPEVIWLVWGERLGFGDVKAPKGLYYVAEFGNHSEEPISRNGKEHPGKFPRNH